jgi:protein-L-isoaspartate(D-aspartate) O-methyltransferase
MSPLMPDFATARRMMVDGQIRTYDVTDPAVLSAMLAVPRERFVQKELAGVAYIDTDVPVGNARRLLKPMVLAKLLQAAAIRPEMRVLDVGCATGYASAVLARMGAQVVALEEDSSLAAEARRALADASEVTVVEGTLAVGWPDLGPYDVILVNGAVEAVPPALFKQLASDGRLVGIVGEPPACQAMLYGVSQGVGSGRAIFDATAGRLPGFSKPAAFAF